MFKRLTAAVLCAVMVLSLFGCTGNSYETTTSPTPDSVGIYESAVSAVKEADSMTLTITMDKTMTLGASEFHETAAQTLILQDIGGETFAASSEVSLEWPDGYGIDVDEQYAQGVYYQSVDDRPYSMEMTAEDFLARQIPSLPLNPELYETITVTAENTIEFSGATALENWLATETSQLQEAGGLVTLDENGQLTESRYTAAYTDGPASFQIQVTVAVDLTKADAKAPLTISYEQLDDPDVVVAQERAYGYLLQADSITSSLSETSFSAAAGVLMAQQTNVDVYLTEGDQACKVAYDIQLMDYTTMEYETYTQEEIFADGTYTYIADGGEPEISNYDDQESITTYWLDILQAHMYSLDYVDSLTTADLGEYWVVENTYSVEFGQYMNQIVNYYLFNDAEFLDGYAESYRTVTATSYMGIDKLTGLPTSVGVDYEGIHTISGEEWALTFEAAQSFDLGSLSSYKSVTGESLPPEQEPAGITPLFYHVTGSDGQELWLLGTIHVGDVRTTNLPQQILDAFAASDALAVEFDSDAFEQELEEDETLQRQISAAYYYSDGTTIQDHIQDTELYEYTVNMLKVTGDYSSNAMMLKPYILANSVENWFLDWGYELSSGYGVDNQLMEMARQQGKEILDVESGLFQIQMITGFSDALQEMLLLETMATTAIEYNASCLELFEMWCEGDEAALIAYLNEDPEEELTAEEQALLDEYNNAMGADRNDDMLNVAIDYLESGNTVFFAVGLAHLLDETGLVNTLRSAGYTVELVAYDN